jgi:hypothetical protein
VEAKFPIVEASEKDMVSGLSKDESAERHASEDTCKSNWAPAVSLGLTLNYQGWRLGSWKPPLRVVKSRSEGVELLNLVLSYLTDAGLTLLRYEVNEEDYLPPCEQVISDAAKLDEALGDDDCRSLREALYLQNANWDKTRRWWDQISTNRQQLVRIFVVGRHVLKQLEQEFSVFRQGPQDPHVSTMLRRSTSEVQVLTLRAQFALAQMHDLARLSSVWSKKMGFAWRSGGIGLSRERLVEAVEMLLDWQVTAELLSHRPFLDWFRVWFHYKHEGMAPTVRRVKFTFGNPLNLPLPPYLPGEIRSVLVSPRY